MRTARLAAWLTGLLALGGCATIESPLDSRLVGQLREGQTRAEVQRVFGRPSASELGANGVVLEHYRRSSFSFGNSLHATRRNGQLELQNLDVLYSPDGVVQRHRFSEGTLIVVAERFELQGGPRLETDLVGRIRCGQSTRSELVGAFGEPLVEGLTLKGSARLDWFFVTGPQPNNLQGWQLSVILDDSDRVADFKLIQSKL